MANDTVDKKIGKAAGPNDKTIIAAIDIIQKERDAMQEEWELEGTEIAKASIMENLKDDYIVLKAYVNKAKEDFRKEVKKKNSDDMTH